MDLKIEGPDNAQRHSIVARSRSKMMTKNYYYWGGLSRCLNQTFIQINWCALCNLLKLKWKEKEKIILIKNIKLHLQVFVQETFVWQWMEFVLTDWWPHQVAQTVGQWSVGPEGPFGSSPLRTTPSFRTQKMDLKFT